MPKIFAIIVNFKENKKTLSLLQSLAKQQGNFELTTLVIDNSGNENLRKYFPKNSTKKILIDAGTNLGFARAVNRGIRLALHQGADFVWLVNPDTLIPADFLKRILKNKTDIIGPVIKYPKNRGWSYDLGGKIAWRWGRTKHTEISNFKFQKKH